MFKNGYIPEEIAVICRSEQKIINRWWDDLDVEETINVIPTFVSDAASKQSIQTGISWAKNRNYGKQQPEPKVETQKNIPFSGLRIVSLEHRGNGGRAYKVVDNHNRYFDLREDVLLDVMRKVGVNSNAELNGEFVWAKVGSQTKLIRVGSDLHQSLVEGSKRRKMPKLNKDALEVGSIYVTKSGSYGVFLGYIDCTEYSIDSVLFREDPRQQYHYYGQPRHIESFKVKVNRVAGKMLWYNYESYNKNKPIDEVKSDITKGLKFNDRYNIHNLDAKKSHSFIQKVGQINVSENIIQTALTEYRKTHDEDVNSAFQHEKMYSGPLSREYILLSRLEPYCAVYFACEAGKSLDPNDLPALASLLRYQDRGA